MLPKSTKTLSEIDQIADSDERVRYYAELLEFLCGKLDKAGWRKSQGRFLPFYNAHKDWFKTLPFRVLRDAKEVRNAIAHPDDDSLSGNDYAYAARVLRIAIDDLLDLEQCSPELRLAVQGTAPIAHSVEEERQKRALELQRAEEDKRRAEDELQRVKEEAEQQRKLRVEEEAKRRAEDQQRKSEEEHRLKREADRLKKAETDRRKAEEDRKKAEEEKRKVEEELQAAREEARSAALRTPEPSPAATVITPRLLYAGVSVAAVLIVVMILMATRSKDERQPPLVAENADAAPKTKDAKPIKDAVRDGNSRQKGQRAENEGTAVGVVRESREERPPPVKRLETGVSGCMKSGDEAEANCILAANKFPALFGPSPEKQHLWMEWVSGLEADSLEAKSKIRTMVEKRWWLWQANGYSKALPALTDDVWYELKVLATYRLKEAFLSPERRRTLCYGAPIEHDGVRIACVSDWEGLLRF